MAEPQITYRVAAHLSTKGDLAKSMGQKAAAVGGFSAKLDAASSKAMAFGRAQTQAMMGAASAVGKYSAAIAGMAVAGGIGMMIAKGAELNAGMERATNTIAGTLQMFGHSAGAADQLGQNIKIAGAAMEMLSKIADESPGEMKDIQSLFQNMLPGARSVTSEMGRIMDLTKTLAVYTPTLGGDFGLVGAQMSRMLTGGAGAEMETWRTLQVPILKAGQAMDLYGKKGKKVFSETQQEGEKLTQAFNKLSKEDRLRVVEAAMKGGADDLAKMYAKSWEGASSSAISSLRRIAAAFTKPMFESIKSALIKANGEGGVLGKEGMSKLLTAASAVGGLLAKGVVKVLGGIEKAVTYLSNNWQKVANTVYHAMQIGAGLLKGAFAWGLTKMIAGAAIIAAAFAVKTGTAVGKGISAGMGAGKSAVKGVAAFATSTKKFVDTVTKGNPIANALGAVTGLISGFSKIAVFAAVLVPLLIVAGAAFAVMGVGLIAVAGIAAYLVSKWDELSASIVKGFNDGTITLKPLIIAAMVLWEKMKAVGKALIGGATGGSMMQWAIDLAAKAVNGVTAAVSGLLAMTATFIRWVGKAADVVDFIAGETDVMKVEKKAQDLSARSNYDIVEARDIATRKYHAGDYDKEFAADAWSTKANAMADEVDRLAGAFDTAGLKDLDLGAIDKMTERLTEELKKILGLGDEEGNKKKKGPAVNINHLVQQFDLRGEDPDRAMVAWVEPIERLARTPGGSTLDVGGF
jgi:hypothetical protein